MTKKQLKLKAQDALMYEISKVGYNMDNDLTDTEREELMKEIKKQGDRIAKLFGYNEMWFV